MAANKKVMSDEERLKLLEERYKKKEISKEAYESMKRELEGKKTTHVMPVASQPKSPKHLSPEERLELLEKRHKNKEISDKTYNQLKAELESETLPPTPAPVPSTAAPAPRAKKLPALPVVIVIVIVVIIILAALGTGVFNPSASTTSSKKENEIVNEVSQWEEVETIEGDIQGGGPMTFVPDVVESFEVEDTVYQLDILLTWDPQDMDLDLVVKDPSGDERGSSGNSPGTPESVRIKKNIDPGTWTAEIDPFFAVNVHYTLEITHYHESGNQTGGEGDLLYQQVKNLAGESGEETDNFQVEDDYEGLFIQVEISSGGGSMEMQIVDPNGDEICSIDISGEDQASYQDTVDSKKGEWDVNYVFDEFTGNVVVQVIGM